MKKLFCCTSEPAASLSGPVETLHAATQTTPGQRGGGREGVAFNESCLQRPGQYHQ